VGGSRDCWEDPTEGKSVCRVFEAHPREAAITAEILQSRPQSWVNKTGIAIKGGRSDQDWLTNVAYWAAYRAGPIQIPTSAPGHADAWNRIAARVKTALAKVDKNPVGPKDPKIDPDPDPGPNVDPDPGPNVDPGPVDNSKLYLIGAGVAALLLLTSRKR
jgi:hypothetical protein